MPGEGAGVSHIPRARYIPPKDGLIYYYNNTRSIFIQCNVAITRVWCYNINTYNITLVFNFLCLAYLYIYMLLYSSILIFLYSYTHCIF